jgi:hypothetical protein
MRPLTLLAAWLLAGCVPLLPHSYYRPVAEGGRIVVNPCWGTPSRVQFDAGELTVTVSVMRPRRGADWNFEMQLDVPEGTTVELVSRRLGDVTIGRLSRVGDPELPMEPLGPMVGGKLPGGGTRKHFWLYAPVDEDEEIIRVAPASLLVNGKLAMLPEIRFHRETHVQVMAPLQC